MSVNGAQGRVRRGAWVVLFVIAAGVGCAPRGAPSQAGTGRAAGVDSDGEAAAIDQARAILAERRRGFVVDEAAQDGEAYGAAGARKVPLLPVSDYALVRSGERFVAPQASTTSTTAPPIRGATVDLPVKGDAPFRVTDVETDLQVDVRLIDAAAVTGHVADGYVVYAGPAPDRQVLLRPVVGGVEDYLVILKKPKVPSVTYEIALGPRVAGLRKIGDVIELLDAGGAPRLRMGAPVLVEEQGATHLAHVDLVGCKADEDPAPPWGRAVTEPGARRCEVRVSWKGEAVRYPAVLDPPWTTTGTTMMNPRQEHTATVLTSGLVLLAGGRVTASVVTATCELFNPAVGAGGSFAMTGAMLSPRYRHSAVRIGDGRVLVAGGASTSAPGARADSEMYNAAGVWALSGSMAEARTSQTATLLGNGTVIQIGGQSAAGTAIATADVCTPTGSGCAWVPTRGRMATPRFGHTATVLRDGRVLVVGGNGAATAELYNPGTVSTSPAGMFSPAGPPVLERFAHAAVLLPGSGLVLIAGGSGASTAGTTAEVYNAATNTFSSTGDLRNPHGACLAVLVPQSGKVLLTGGLPMSPIGSATPELYDPAARTWSTAGPLVTPRSGGHTETLLADGRVLVTGGLGPISSAELFDPCTGAACADTNPCTFDSCSAAVGCLHVDASACGGSFCGLPAAGCTTWKDTDGDGLSDKWEQNRYVDVNCNGTSDAGDVVLFSAGSPTLDPTPPDVNLPDVYVAYDWLEGPAIGPCNPSNGIRDCLVGGATFTDQTCVPRSTLTGVCKHTHDPDAIAPGTMAAVKSKFRAHGINLHLVRGRGLPHVAVVTFDALGAACQGTSAARLSDLKATSGTLSTAAAAVYHYTVFAHYSSCDNNAAAPCTSCGHQFGETGIAEIGGGNFIVSLGNVLTDLRVPPNPFLVAGTFMHELGHNFGLHHAGGKTTAADAPNYKPNYLSVMNYRYQLVGIQAASTVGGTLAVPALQRFDYSSSVLPVVSTPAGMLDESQLHEPPGLSSGTADLFSFTDSTCTPRTAPSNGPADWNGSGVTDLMPVIADLNPQEDPSRNCGDITNEVMTGYADWSTAGPSNFSYSYQCAPAGGFGGGASGAGELTGKTAFDKHVLLAPRAALTDVRPGCKTHWVTARQAGTVQVALLGRSDLDVKQVEPASLRLSGSAAAEKSIQVKDVNGDKIPDLVVDFPMESVRLDGKSTTANLSGWLKSSQLFTSAARVTVVPSAGPVVTLRTDKKTGFSMMLAPQKGQYATVTIARLVQGVVDRCDVKLPINDRTLKVTSVTWDEPASGLEKVPDVVLVQPGVIKLLREARSEGGRVYTVHLLATDTQGNATEAAARIAVTAAPGRPVIDKGPHGCVGACSDKQEVRPMEPDRQPDGPGPKHPEKRDDKREEKKEKLD